MTKTPQDETLLGIDFGEANIGLALGRNGLTTPLHTVSGANEDQAIREIARFVIENKVDRIVMGLPLTAENKETAKSLQVRSFSKKLKIAIKKPVIFINEYMTSKTALKGSISMGMSQKSRRTIDHIAAALILKNYFDSEGLA